MVPCDDGSMTVTCRLVFLGPPRQYAAAPFPVAINQKRYVNNRLTRRRRRRRRCTRKRTHAHTNELSKPYILHSSPSPCINQRHRGHIRQRLPCSIRSQDRMQPLRKTPLCQQGAPGYCLPEMSLQRTMLTISKI